MTIELITAALAAGAAAGLTDTTSAAIKDSYTALRDGVRRKLGSSAGDDDELPEEAELAEALTAAGAGDDEELVATAAGLLSQLDPQGAQSGKYAGLQIFNNQTVVVGDHGTFYFGSGHGGA